MKENKIKTKKQILKNRRKAKKTNKKKGKIESRVAYDSMTTKKNTFLWKICKTKQKTFASYTYPFKEKGKIIITNLAQSMGKKYYFNTSTFMNCDKK
jgi:hypothetical protein